MKAIELRINNYARLLGQTVKVNGQYIKEQEQSEMVEGESYLEAIPLTEEWLSRFGFNDDGVIYYQEENYDPYLLIVDLKTECVDNCYYSHTRFSIDIPYTLKYVHELQNLYFALFQKELTL